MRFDLDQKPEGVWCSFNEFCGIGDGETREYKTPIPASEARSVLVTRSTNTFEMLAPDNRSILRNEKDGTILKDEPDGYKLETRGGGLAVPTDEDPTPDQGGDELWIVLDRPLAFGVRLSVSGLGRKVGDSFKIVPMTPALNKRISDKQPAAFKKRDRAGVTEADVIDAGRISFIELVADWSGIKGANGPLPCDADSKLSFLNHFDVIFFSLFVSNRAAAIRAERINSQERDSSD